MDFFNIQLINTVTLGTPMMLDNIVIVVDSDMLSYHLPVTCRCNMHLEPSELTSLAYTGRASDMHL